MPTPAQIAGRLDPITAPISYVRLTGDRQGIETVTATWNKIVLEKSADLAETAVVIRDLSKRVPVYVFASNHFAGCAPETVRELRRLLGHGDLPSPKRPKTTLFD